MTFFSRPPAASQSEEDASLATPAKPSSLGVQATNHAREDASLATPAKPSSTGIQATLSPFVKPGLHPALLPEKVCQARGEMQLFRAKLQRTNPVAEEIAGDLDAFMQGSHSSEEFQVKLQD